jgi:hypothetical protein
LGELLDAKGASYSFRISKEKAILISKSLGVVNFKASNGWLSRFKTRHNIKNHTISGESFSSGELKFEEFYEKFFDLSLSYEAKNIFNWDETSLFYKTASLFYKTA